MSQIQDTQTPPQASSQAGGTAPQGRRRGGIAPLTNQQKDEARELARQLGALSPQLLTQVMRYLRVDRPSSMLKSAVCQTFAIAPVALAIYNPTYRNFSYNLFAVPLAHNRHLVNMLAIVSHGQELSREVLVSGDPAAYQAAVTNLNMLTDSEQTVQKAYDSLLDIATRIYANLGREMPNPVTAPPEGHTEAAIGKDAASQPDKPMANADAAQEQTSAADVRPKK